MKKNTAIKIIAWAMLLFAFTSCVSTAHVEKDQSVNFSGYKTYSWIGGEDGGNKRNDLLEMNVHNSVNQELQKSGWKQVNTNPDVLLSYDMLVEKGNKQQRDPVYSQPTTRAFFNPYTRRWGTIYYPSQFLGYDNRTVTVKEGTLTITMIDARTEKTIWQGWNTEEVNSRNLTRKEIQGSVKSIFRKFDTAKR
jgi:Domain of unknown function (DUF4136)